MSLPVWLLQQIATADTGAGAESPVARLLSATPDRPAWVGWRCGGSQYPEFQLSGLEACYKAGYSAVDIGVRRTSDNVLVCAHDWNTSHLTGQNIEFWKTPWSEIQKLTYLDGKTHYQRLETLVEALPPSMALVLDFKNTSSNPNFTADNADGQAETQLWNYLKGVFDKPKEHVINKSFIESQIHVRARTALGLKSMVMLYDDKAKTVDSSQFDILGLNWNANNSNWAALKAYGKPTIAHIVGDVDAYNGAKADQPSMFMCGMPNTYGPMH